jgi:D-alanine-D-alanine ligase
LPWSEIDFSEMPKGMPAILTYRGKWDDNSDEYRGSMPRLDPKLPAAVRARVAGAATRAFKALECKGYARVDVRVDRRGHPYVIDINPNCDLSPQGGFFKAVRAAHMSYADMALHIVELALGATLGPPHSQDVRPRLGTAARAHREAERLQPRRATSRARAR